jgi:mRNA interferase RelE/StbE
MYDTGEFGETAVIQAAIERLERAIDALAVNPRPPGKLVKAIQGTKDEFLRMRVGDYRIMYEIVDAKRLVLLLGIIHRKEVEQWLRQRG